MELGFIVTSLRRRWWLVAVALLLGIALAASIDGDDTVEYRSEAQIEVLPDPTAGSVYNGQPDRFVATEIAAMRADGLVDAVAEAVPTDPDVVDAATTLRQLPGTQIIVVSVTTDDADLAPAIANAYAEIYLEQSRLRNGGARQAQLAELETEIIELTAALAEVNQRASDIAAAYVDSLPTEEPLPPPNIQIIAPDIGTQQTLLLAELNRARTNQDTLEREAQRSVPGTIIDRADDPQRITGDSPTLARAAVVLGALMLGLVAAPLSMQLSDRVTEAADVEALLTRRVVGHLGWSARLRRSPLAALAGSPREHRDVERRLWARVEWGASSAEGVGVVAVVAPSTQAGTTTLTLALARRAAEQGLRTVVVDADTSRPWLSDHLVGEEDPSDTTLDTRLRLAPTPRPGVSVLAATAVLGRGTPVEEVLAALGPDVDLAIVDGGDLLSSATALVACEAADTVVVAVPLGRVRENDLRDTAALLVGEGASTVDATVLAVTTRPSRRAAAGAAYDGTAAAEPPAADTDATAVSATAVSDAAVSDTTTAAEAEQPAPPAPPGEEPPPPPPAARAGAGGGSRSTARR